MISSPLLPIFVDLCLKNYLAFQWDFGFRGTSEDSESVPMFKLSLLKYFHSFPKFCNLTILSQFYCSILMNSLVVESKAHFPSPCCSYFFNSILYRLILLLMNFLFCLSPPPPLLSPFLFLYLQHHHHWWSINFMLDFSSALPFSCRG